MKKDFKNNPALQFLSVPEDVEEAQPKATQKPVPAGKRRTPPPGYKNNPEFLEVKSRRVQLILRQSLFDEATAARERLGVSMNEYVSLALEEKLERDKKRTK